MNIKINAAVVSTGYTPNSFANGRDEVLNGDNLNFVKANIKQKKFGIILSQVTVFKIFENGLNQCV